MVFLGKHMYTKFGTLQEIISDGVSHVCNKVFCVFIKKYVVKHKVATPYYSQMSGQLKYQIGRSKKSQRKSSMWNELMCQGNQITLFSYTKQFS